VNWWNSTSEQAYALKKILPMSVARFGEGFAHFKVEPILNWRFGMMKMSLAVLLVLCAVNVAFGDDVAYRNVKVVDAKGKQADASLIY
jgi:hypothetical protein